MISIFLVLIPWAANATAFRGVPADCQRQLLALPVAARHDLIDWRLFVAHLRRTNFAARTGPVSGTEFRWWPETALRLAREAFDDPAWDWSVGFTADASYRLGQNSAFDVSSLPLWAGVRGFDPVAAMRGYFDSPGRQLYPPEQEAVAAVAPFWLRGPDALVMALAFWRGFNSPYWRSALDVVHDQLPPEERDRFRTVVLDDITSAKRRPGVHDDHNLILRTLPCAGAVMRHIGNARRSDWIDLERDPARRVRGVRHVTFDLARGGWCDEMSTGHLKSLTDPRRLPPRPVFVDGVLVGVIKRRGDPSMLALRNITDARGRLVLVTGGVYRVANSALTDEPESVIRGQPRALRLDDLGVRAVSFLFHWVGWREGRPGLIAKAVKPYLDEDARKRLRRAVADLDGVSLRLDEATERVAWRAMLRALVDYRARIECLYQE